MFLENVQFSNLIMLVVCVGIVINQAALAAIYKSFKTIFGEAFTTAPEPDWPKVAMQAPSDNETEDYVWLGEMPAMKEWIGDRKIKDLAGFHYEIRNKDFEATVEVDRNKIEDDRIGIYKPMFQGLAVSAKIHPDTLIFALLAAGASTKCFDGVNFFATTHKVAGANVVNYTAAGGNNLWVLMDTTKPVKPLILQLRKNPEFVAQDQPEGENVFMRKKFRYGVDYRSNVGFGFWQLAYGSCATLSNTNYNLHRTAMKAFKNDEGMPLGIRPNLLVCGPSNEAAARTLLLADRDAAGAANIWFNSAQLLVCDWLT